MPLGVPLTIILGMNFFHLFMVLLFVGILWCYQTYYLCTNTTTIESWEKDRVATLVRRKKIHRVKYPYDIGVMKNIRSVLGPSMMYWLWPCDMRGDGLSFPIRTDGGKSDGTHSVSDIESDFYWAVDEANRIREMTMNIRHSSSDHEVILAPYHNYADDESDG